MNKIETTYNSFRLVMDIDGTICTKEKNKGYSEAIPNIKIINMLKKYKEKGFYIILHTSRQMRTYNNNIGKINANTLPIIIEWMNKYDVPYDEIHVGKPWCGTKGFYVDDKSIRPDEFISLTYKEIKKKLDIYEF